MPNLLDVHWEKGHNLILDYAIMVSKWLIRRVLMNLGMATETLEFKKSTSEIKEAIQSIGAKL